jgi:hypothetical protein
MLAIEGPVAARDGTSSCGIGAEICLGALMAGRAFLFPPLLREILDRSCDMAGCGDLADCAMDRMAKLETMKQRNKEQQKSLKQLPCLFVLCGVVCADDTWSRGMFHLSCRYQDRL